MRRRYTAWLSVASVMALLLPTWWSAPARIVYNASVSAPLGWYWIEATRHVQPGDFVIVQLPRRWAALAEQRGYLPAHIPLLKRVAAVAGAGICVRNDVLYIDDVPRARLLIQDGRGRTLPRQMPCRALMIDELLLLNTEHAASFDSRYFGPVSVRTLRGKAVPLWTWRGRDR